MRPGDVGDGAGLHGAGPGEDGSGVESEELAGQVVSAGGQDEEVEAGDVLEDVYRGLETLNTHHLPVPDSGQALGSAQHQDVLHPHHGQDLVRRGQARHHGPGHRALGLHGAQVGRGALDDLLQSVDPVDLAGEVLAHEVERLLQLAHGVYRELEGVGSVGVVDVVNLNITRR